MSALKPLGFLYEKAAGLKNVLYENAYLKSVKLDVPVVSLGNLTMGGTGKTPLTHFCLQHYARRKLKAAVVSRNYRAEVKTMAKVDLSSPRAAAFFGDEPVLLAQTNPTAEFFVGPEKYKTAEWAAQQTKPDVLLIDDGFQHRQLQRDLDLVILDATEPLSGYQCLPEGRAREPWSGLGRADAFLISKVNLSSQTYVEQLQKKLRPFGKPIFLFDFRIGSFYEMASGKRWSTAARKEKAMLVSGIARPDVFEKSLHSFSLQVKEHARYRDHHAYTALDVESILRRWQNAGQPLLVTTEKDCVKLRSLWPKGVPLWVVPLEVQIQSEEEAFYEILDGVLR